MGRRDRDTVLIESTYGDRLHPPTSLQDELADALTRLAARGGVAVVPVFAVGRAQTLLHAIARVNRRFDEEAVSDNPFACLLDFCGALQHLHESLSSNAALACFD